MASIGLTKFEKLISYFSPRKAALRAWRRVGCESERQGSWKPAKHPYDDSTPVIDQFGDKSTVGFERMFRDLWNKATTPIVIGHEFDEATLKCRACGIEKRDASLGRVACIRNNTRVVGGMAR